MTDIDFTFEHTPIEPFDFDAAFQRINDMAAEIRAAWKDESAIMDEKFQKTLGEFDSQRREASEFIDQMYAEMGVPV